jgi:Uncharacterized conserved protein (DUF2358)
MAAELDILDILAADYRNFPRNQTYSLYAPDVYFKDPMNEFRGRERYQQMIGLIERLFGDPQLDLHQIRREGNQIRSDWTLHWTTPLPWKPRIQISGWSELETNAAGLISSHQDYWHCSRWEVLQQHFWRRAAKP